MGRILLLAFLGGSLYAASPTGSAAAQAIRDAGLDPAACFRVRDLSYYKEDIKLYFNDGYLIFSRPLNGERFGAIFIGEVEGGDGELLLLAPNRAERLSLAKYTQSPNLNEHFIHALMLFTDGAGQELMDSITQQGRGKPVPEMGPELAEKWSPTLENVAEGLTIRLLEDVLNPARKGGGFFLAAILGKQLGPFDLLFDPRAAEEILVGQRSVGKNGLSGYNIWTRFPAASSRASKTKRPLTEVAATRFSIDAKLAADLSMVANTKVRLDIGSDGVRAIPFEISRAMAVKSVRVDGAPAEFLVLESERGRAMRPGENDVFLVVTPDVLAAGSTHEVEFEHEGRVIATRGKGVYFVGARSNWYPSAGDSLATYELKFRYPKDLTLVTPGEITEDSTEGDWRTTVRSTPKIRMAGFNLGDYQKLASSSGGFNVEVYANRNLEPNLLLPANRMPILVEPPRAPIGRGRQPADIATLVQAPPPPDPLARLRIVAADVSAASQYFTGIFGPPPLKTLTVSPIPDTFGQGFPGLIYLSTLSYLKPEERPLSMRGSRQQTFFSDIIQAHEVAHQWWGNLIFVESYQDDWMMEALAQYSALMWIEKKKGVKALEDVLEDYREDLLKSDSDGKTIESAGPLTWGYRIESGTSGEAWRLITYEKGAWVLHMLRQRMGDANFLKMLGELRKRFEYKPVTTRELQSLCREFLPPRTSASVIDSFFDNWIYATGIPTLKVKSSHKGVAPAIRVTGTVEQIGVADDFTVDIPVEVQFAKAPSQIVWVRTSNEPATFGLTVKLPPARVITKRDVLADR